MYVLGNEGVQVSNVCNALDSSAMEAVTLTLYNRGIILEDELVQVLGNEGVQVSNVCNALDSSAMEAVTLTLYNWGIILEEELA